MCDLARDVALLHGRLKRSSAIIYWMAFLAPAPLLAQTPVIVGQVVDSVTEEPVAGVVVTLRNTGLSGLTDRDGRFTIPDVPIGVYTLSARRVGYTEAVRGNVRIDAGTRVTIDFQLAPLPVRLRDITITPGAFTFLEARAAAQQTMSREEIESVPQFGEDIFRAVNRLPGLSSGDYTAHFSIRGGRQDETLIRIDGLEIYEPYHLKDFNEGAISVIDVETIEGVELLTGGFPAQYGNKRSGVFSMTSIRPTPGQTRFRVGLSLLHARGMAEGTFARGKGSWFVSARRGYLDLVLGLLNQDELPSPSYFDVFSKLQYQVHPRHTLSLNGLHAGDQYTFDANSTTGFGDSIPTREFADNRYGNSYVWLTLNSLLGDRLGVTTMASAGLITATRDGTEFHRLTGDSIYGVLNHRDYSVLGIKQDWSYEATNNLLIDFGYDLRALHAEYDIASIVAQNPDDPSADSLSFYPQLVSSNLTREGTSVALYLSNRLQVIDPLTLEVGLRYDRISYSGDEALSPRVNALVRLAERNHLRLGWGLYRQSQGIADLQVLNNDSEYFPSELSKQWTLGYERTFTQGAVRVEAYHKQGSNLRPIYRNWKGSPDVFLESNEDRVLVFPNNSTAKGIEVYFSQDLSSKTSLRGSYAFAFADETVSRIDNINDPTPIDFAQTHPNPQDQRHAANVDLAYRPNTTWTIHSSYAFHTGWPATLQSIREVTGMTGQPDFAIKPDTLYGDRLPNYHRLDARATRRWKAWGGDLRFFFEVTNLTNHSNVFGYDYTREPDASGVITLQRSEEKWFIILPSLGVSWTASF